MLVLFIKRHKTSEVWYKGCTCFKNRIDYRMFIETKSN